MSTDPRTPGLDPSVDGLPDLPEASESDVMKRLEAVHRMRALLTLMLLPPLLFFIFLVVWFHEGFILVPIGVGLYLYMLVQFFVVQNPARRARRREGRP